MVVLSDGKTGSDLSRIFFYLFYFFFKRIYLICFIDYHNRARYYQFYYVTAIEYQLRI